MEFEHEEVPSKIPRKEKPPLVLEPIVVVIPPPPTEPSPESLEELRIQLASEATAPVVREELQEEAILREDVKSPVSKRKLKERKVPALVEKPAEAPLVSIILEQPENYMPKSKQSKAYIQYKVSRKRYINLPRDKDFEKFNVDEYENIVTFRPAEVFDVDNYLNLMRNIISENDIRMAYDTAIRERESKSSISQSLGMRKKSSSGGSTPREISALRPSVLAQPSGGISTLLEVTEQQPQLTSTPIVPPVTMAPIEEAPFVMSSELPPVEQITTAPTVRDTQLEIRSASPVRILPSSIEEKSQEESAIHPVETTPRRPDTYRKKRVSPLMVMDKYKYIVDIVTNFDYSQGNLTLEDVCRRPINRFNIAVAFTSLLDLSKSQHVKLFSLPDSIKFSHIMPGNKLTL